MDEELNEIGLTLTQLAFRLEILGRHTDAILLSGLADSLAQEIRQSQRRKRLEAEQEAIRADSAQ